MKKKKKEKRKLEQWVTWWLLSKRWAFVTFVPSGICQDYCFQCQQMLFQPSYLMAC